MLRSLQEPKIRIFLDNCIWLSLLGLGDNPNSPEELAFRAQYEQIIESLDFEQYGLMFSPCLYLDAPKSAPIKKFEAAIKRFEQAGFLTILGEATSWSAIATLKAKMWEDFAGNPTAFQNMPLSKRRFSALDVAIVFSAIKYADELWTRDPMVLAFNGRPSVRNLLITEPHSPEQGKLFSV